MKIDNRLKAIALLLYIFGGMFITLSALFINTTFWNVLAGIYAVSLLILMYIALGYLNE